MLRRGCPAKIGAMTTLLDSTRVAEAMHPGTVTCPPETPLRTVARMMARYSIHCVVVLADIDEADWDGRLWGVVSDLDLVEAAAGADVDERTAGGTAASPLITIAPDETLERAAQLMAEHETSHLVVVDPASDRPVGVLSTLDVARVVAD
jgi:CBS domain-containing protein